MRSKDPELMKRIQDYIDHYFMVNHRVPSQRDIAKDLNISHTTSYRYLNAMGENGMISYNEGKITGSRFIDKFSMDSTAGPITGIVPCGSPEEEEEQIEEYVSLPTSIFGKGDFFILRAIGTSMVDAGIHPGSLVVIRRQETAEVGDAVVALDDENQNTLKKFGGFDPETGKAVLLYQNEEEYPGRKILVENLVVQGVATKIISDLWT